MHALGPTIGQTLLNEILERKIVRPITVLLGEGKRIIRTHQSSCFCGTDVQADPIMWPCRVDAALGSADLFGGEGHARCQYQNAFRVSAIPLLAVALLLLWDRASTTQRY
jgi:hypothetical protein